MGWSPSTSSDPWTEIQTPGTTLTPALIHPAGCKKTRATKKYRVASIHKRVMKLETIIFQSSCLLHLHFKI